MLVLMTLNFMVSTPIMCIGGIIMAAARGRRALLAGLGLGARALRRRRHRSCILLMPLFRQMQDRIDGINGVLREQIIGIRVVRAFVREPFETERYRGRQRQAHPGVG